MQPTFPTHGFTITEECTHQMIAKYRALAEASSKSIKTWIDSKGADAWGEPSELGIDVDRYPVSRELLSMAAWRSYEERIVRGTKIARQVLAMKNPSGIVADMFARLTANEIWMGTVRDCLFTAQSMEWSGFYVSQSTLIDTIRSGFYQHLNALEKARHELIEANIIYVKT